ncbi:sensor histidine kinase [Chryseobacterium indoltheticum]|uniref:histidine kinase n=1 Tax=Chryseobacterium indoltheticum TaxID=254 RepID=A0A381F4K8_9FLAO|nr:ATP-binding protein [Chryseobacterium indoltheticum]AZA75022.1 histidine kinase [Chryseobacterium indoltheticum]SIQ58542.1 Histidine kinase-, DNA gyrase B-, and HSP90-like ATPase [Chryseobacterium indoltheticum]SUX41485.1 Sensor protein ZraS [Chryseobacterium indoltheticum]
MKKQQFFWLLFILLAIVSGIFAFDFYSQNRWINYFLFSSISLICIILAQKSASSYIQKTEKLLLAIQKKDFSLFPEAEQNSLLDSAVKLYYQSKEEHLSHSSYKLLYEEILNQLEIGLMILSEKNNEWEVFYVNPVFLEILEIPKYNHWNLYESKTPNFYKIIEQTQYENSQEFFDISINENTKQSFSLRTKKVENVKNRFCIISLESVQKIIEQKEKLAWNNLMKVISHELLNTLTPVNSLIQNLEYIANQEAIDKEDQKDMQESLMIINNKSKQLLNFVDDYRQVAELPKPVFKTISLSDIVESALNFLKPEFEKNNIKIINSLENQTVFADQKMIERCLINLYLNAIYAVEGTPEKNIRTEIKTLNKRIVLSVEDSGIGIPSEIKDKIFLPFFTTRISGSGIGLTLSKSIIEAHKGYLNYKALEHGSQFEIWFLS